MRQRIKDLLLTLAIAVALAVPAIYIAMDYQDAQAISGPSRSGVLSGQVTCSTSTVQLTPAGVRSTCIKNPAGGTTVFIGGAGVTTATGFELAAGEAYCDDVRNVGLFYCDIASGTQVIHWIGSN